MSEAERERGFALHEEAQRRAWLALSYRERLTWLEEAKRFAVLALTAAARRKQQSDPSR
jgi:20S proteasome alpha/beta subunit